MTRLLAPLNRLWVALSPLVGLWRTLVSVLEAGAPYAWWCLGCALGIALLGLAGFELLTHSSNRTISETARDNPSTISGREATLASRVVYVELDFQ